MKQKSRSKDGYVLPAVLMFIIFSVALGMAALELGVIEAREAVQRGRREAAFYLAEAGLVYARAGDLALDEGEFLEMEVGEGKSFSLARIENGWESTGRFGGKEETVRQTSGSSPGVGFVWMDHVDVNEDNVTPEDALQQGIRADYPDRIQMPPTDWTGGEGYSDAADDDGDLFNNDSGTPLIIPSGDHRVRDVKAAAHAKIVIQDGVRLFVTGDIQLPASGTIEVAEAEDGAEAKGVEIFVDEGSRIQLPGNVVTLSGDPAHLRIYSNSGHTIESETDDVKFPSHAEFYGMIYAPDAVVDLVNHTSYHGGIVAGTLLARNHTTLTYYEHLADVWFNAGIDIRTVLEWTKPGWRRFE